MQSRLNVYSSRPVVESLEGRSLMSGLSPLNHRALGPAMIGHVHPAIATDPAGVAAIKSALSGGMGKEWITLIHRELKNPLSVIGGFETGKYTSYSIPGLISQTPSVQPEFTGQPYDQLLPTVAGAVLLKGLNLELGAIMRGPFHDPAQSYYVFALNRGAGAALGPTFASRPGITPDVLVTLTVGPYGSWATGTVTDLTTQVTNPISSSSIRIDGSTVRVLLNAAQLPSEGWPLKNYHFAFWTQTQPGNNITTVASFAPAASMIPIGVETNVRPPTL
jgi:hypothetical protein